MSLIVMGLLSTGAQVLNTIPGFTGLPSSYDPKLTIDQAANTSEKPLLIEFYSDTCRTCQIITPWVHELSDKYKDDLTFVMVDVNDAKNAQFAQIFKIEYIPAVFVFDFKHMAKRQIDFNTYGSKAGIDKAIGKALRSVKQQAAQNPNRKPPMMMAS